MLSVIYNKKHMIYINTSVVDKVFFKNNDISCYAKDVLIYPYIPDKIPFTLEYTATTDALSVGIPCQGNVNVTIDWGDGSPIETATKDNAPHGYNTTGKYTVKVIGDFEIIAGGSNNLYRIISWGNTNTTLKKMYSSGFSGAISIPSDEYGAFKNLTDFTYVFSGCSNLTSIPSGLFSNCPLVTDFTGTFSDCTSLTSIPSGLFDNCPNVTDFSNVFTNCSGLTSIPIGLFDKCTKVTGFLSAFAVCTSLTGTVPYDSLGGTQAPTPLYQRSSGVNGYAIVKGGGQCFDRCNGLSDYASIPYDWKSY